MWLLATSWLRLTTSQKALITIVQSAANTFITVTDQQWEDFTRITTWRYKFYSINVDLQTSYCSEAEAYFSQLSIQPSGKFKAALNTLILQLISDNNWNSLDCFYVFATEQQQHARIDIKSPARSPITEINSPSWASGFGYTGNGSSSYINTGINISTLTNFSQNSNCGGIYIRTNSTQSASNFGAYNGSIFYDINARNGSDNFASIINCATFFNNANSDSRGLFSIFRNSSATSAAYINGSVVGSSVLASFAIPSQPMYLMARNNNGSPNNYSTQQISAFFLGSSSVSQSTLYSALQTFATSIGFQV